MSLSGRTETPCGRLSGLWDQPRPARPSALHLLHRVARQLEARTPARGPAPSDAPAWTSWPARPLTPGGKIQSEGGREALRKRQAAFSIVARSSVTGRRRSVRRQTGGLRQRDRQSHLQQPCRSVSWQLHREQRRQNMNVLFVQQTLQKEALLHLYYIFITSFLHLY